MVVVPRNSDDDVDLGLCLGFPLREPPIVRVVLADADPLFAFPLGRVPPVVLVNLVDADFFITFPPLGRCPPVVRVNLADADFFINLIFSPSTPILVAVVGGVVIILRWLLPEVLLCLLVDVVLSEGGAFLRLPL